MDVRTLYTKIRNGSEHQVQEMQVIMESFLKQRSRSFSELNHKEQAERLMRYSDLGGESGGASASVFLYGIRRRCAGRRHLLYRFRGRRLPV